MRHSVLTEKKMGNIIESSSFIDVQKKQSANAYLSAKEKIYFRMKWRKDQEMDASPFPVVLWENVGGCGTYNAAVRPALHRRSLRYTDTLTNVFGREYKEESRNKFAGYHTGRRIYTGVSLPKAHIYFQTVPELGEDTYEERE